MIPPETLSEILHETPRKTLAKSIPSTAEKLKRFAEAYDREQSSWYVVPKDALNPRCKRMYEKLKLRREKHKESVE
jgi:hypothetical protein